MKKLFAASLLSISLCVSQVGGAWAETSKKLSPTQVSDEIEASPDNPVVVGVLVIVIAEIIVYFLLPALDKALTGNDDQDIGKACEFYGEYRTHEGIWDYDYMHVLYDEVWRSSACSYLFDEDGLDVDKHGCYIWKPEWWNDDEYLRGEYDYFDACLAEDEYP